MTKLAATRDTGEAVEAEKSFDAIELPAMVVITVATAVVTSDANVLVDVVVAAVDGIVDAVLRIDFILLLQNTEEFILFPLCFDSTGCCSNQRDSIANESNHSPVISSRVHKMLVVCLRWCKRLRLFRLHSFALFRKYLITLELLLPSSS